MDFRVLIITIGIVGDKTCRCCCETSVHRTGTVSISIAVGICVVGEKRQVVGHAVAIVVDAVAEFGCARMDFRVLIITIGIVGDKTCRCCCETSVHRTGTVSISIAVGICVVGEKRQVVGHAVAIVVDAVAEFGCARMDFRVLIITIGIVGDKTCRCCCETGVHRTGTVSISIAVGISVVGEKRQVVGHAVAIVVDAVA